jgi:Rod binding domain-containing protein
MSLSPINALDPRVAAGAARVAPKDHALARAASEMETVFVRHLLEASKIGGPSGETGYGSMAVDALATGIERGGGLGLARAIEASLSPHHGRPPAPRRRDPTCPCRVPRGAPAGPGCHPAWHAWHET